MSLCTSYCLLAPHMIVSDSVIVSFVVMAVSVAREREHIIVDDHTEVPVCGCINNVLL